MDRNPGIRRQYAFAGGGSLIADPDDLATFQSAQIAHNIGPPVAVTDDTKPNHKIAPLMSTCSELTRNQRTVSVCTRNSFGEEVGKVITSTGAVAGDHCLWRLDQNFQIEPRRTIARVAQIESNHIVKSDPAAALDLPEPGNSRFGFEQAASMPGRVGLHLVRHRGTGSTQGHFAPQQIKKLGK